MGHFLSNGRSARSMSRCARSVDGRDRRADSRAGETWRGWLKRACGDESMLRYATGGGRIATGLRRDTATRGNPSTSSNTRQQLNLVPPRFQLNIVSPRRSSSIMMRRSSLMMTGDPVRRGRHVRMCKLSSGRCRDMGNEIDAASLRHRDLVRVCADGTARRFAFFWCDVLTMDVRPLSLGARIRSGRVERNGSGASRGNEQQQQQK